MDLSNITARALREVAEDGEYGTTEEELWRHLGRSSASHLSNALKQPIWHWVTTHPRISFANGRAKANEDLQYTLLTGASRDASEVGQLAFELLRIVSHFRSEGVSTVEISKISGQDLRSLSGRIQSLVDLGLVKRFPVIENRASTHRLVLASHVLEHNDATGIVDKQHISRRITEFCKAGPHGLRLSTDVIRAMAPELKGIRKSRRRPAIASVVRDLESTGVVRRLSMIDPEIPDKLYACVEYLRDYEPTNRLNVIAADSLDDANDERTDIGAKGASDNTDEDEDEEEETEEGGEEEEDDDEGSYSNGSRAKISDDKYPIERLVLLEQGDQALKSRKHTPAVAVYPIANVSFPLVNQIYEMIKSSGSVGISAMELSKRLTGRAYRKTFGKFLDALTIPSKTKEYMQPPELGHLALVKGIDFNHRVKFYRYFTKSFFSTSASSAEAQCWGVFPEHPRQPDDRLSLLELEKTRANQLAGSCSIVKTPQGHIRPLFHGESISGAEVILVSGPTNDAIGGHKKKRGRPRKNAPKDPPTLSAPIPEVKVDTRVSIPINTRTWRGGKPISGTHRATAWCAHSEENPENALLDSAPSESVLKSVKSCESKGSGDSNRTETTKRKQFIDTSFASGTKPPSSLGSLAYSRRVGTLLDMIKSNNGAILGGTSMMEKFNSVQKEGSTVDRRTINNVIQSLVNSGRLKQIYVNVATGTGASILKYILYDPEIIVDPDRNQLIDDLKSELAEGNKAKHANATRAAIAASRSGTNGIPQKEITLEQLNALRPITGRPGRILTTGSRVESNPRQRMRFGPSAAEVLGVDNSGRPRSSSKKIKSEARYPTIVSDPKALPQQQEERESGMTQLTELGNAPIGINTDWLVRAVVIYISLFTRDGSIDWHAISQGAPGPFTANDVKRKWRQLGNLQTKESIDSRRQQFEELFTRAYEKGEVRLLDDLLPHIALSNHVDWWRHAEESQDMFPAREANSVVRLPLSNIRLKQHDPTPQAFDPLFSLQSQASIVNAEKLLLSSTLGLPLAARRPKMTGEADGLSNDEMRMRAVIAADCGPSYDSAAAAMELEGISDADAKEAIESLERRKIIQWTEADREKVPVGRPYVISDRFLNALSIPRLEMDTPRSASEVSRSLSSGKSIEVPATVNEAEMIVLIELATFGINGMSSRLRRLGDKFGKISDNYKSRGIDKQAFECKTRLDVFKDEHDTDCDRVDASSSNTCRMVMPPKSGNPSRPWLWETNHLSSRGIWFRVAFKIVATALFRPNIPVDVLALSLHKALENDEAIAAINALATAGALIKVKHESVIAAPNWYEYLTF